MVNENLVVRLHSAKKGTRTMLATIGYERANLADFVETLRVSGVEMIVDIRERAQSRRPGFSKSALSGALLNAGIEYVHFPELGDPKEGREAARSGQYDVFRQIFFEVMAMPEAKNAISKIFNIALNKKVCLLCYERDKEQCHRKIVSDQLEKMLECKANHLGVRDGIANDRAVGRVFHFNQSAAAPL
jgi:uncharacterized protein (DUF488 family)